MSAFRTPAAQRRARNSKAVVVAIVQCHRSSRPLRRLSSGRDFRLDERPGVWKAERMLAMRTAHGVTDHAAHGTAHHEVHHIRKDPLQQKPPPKRKVSAAALAGCGKTLGFTKHRRSAGMPRMPGTSPGMTISRHFNSLRHGRACPGHPRSGRNSAH